MRFMTSYHNLSLLQHVTKMTVKVQESELGGSLGGRRGGGVDRVRADLTVTLTTEAIILDGVSARESLVRIPTPVAALGGAAAYYALDINPDVGRRLALMQTNRPLPTDRDPRDYQAMINKDPFHGRLPPIVDPGPPPPVIPPGIGQHIKMSGWTTCTAGSV